MQRRQTEKIGLKKRCIARCENNEPCQSEAMGDSDYCIVHEHSCITGEIIETPKKGEGKFEIYIKDPKMLSAYKRAKAMGDNLNLDDDLAIYDSLISLSTEILSNFNDNNGADDATAFRSRVYRAYQDYLATRSEEDLAFLGAIIVGGAKKSEAQSDLNKAMSMKLAITHQIVECKKYNSEMLGKYWIMNFANSLSSNLAAYLNLLGEGKINSVEAARGIIRGLTDLLPEEIRESGSREA
jgi:hypothetical protein